MKRLSADPYICLISEGIANPDNYDSEKLRILETIREAVADGVNMIQIREKALTARQALDLTSEAVKSTREANALLILNGRADIAAAAGADGVHLAEDSMPPDVVRRVFPRDLLIGVSTHSRDGAVVAADRGADYISFAPVFETPGKGRPAGVEALNVVCKTIERFPVIALGGIDASNYGHAMLAGAAGIAAIRSLNDRDSRRQIVNGLRTKGVR